MKKYISYLIVFHSIWLITSCSPQEEDAVGPYNEGDVISTDHQGMEFDYCYPSNYPESSFSFSNHSEKVFMIEMSATW